MFVRKWVETPNGESVYFAMKLKMFLIISNLINFSL